jgi:hypothetical protein
MYAQLETPLKSPTAAVECQRLPIELPWAGHHLPSVIKNRNPPGFLHNRPGGRKVLARGAGGGGGQEDSAFGGWTLLSPNFHSLTHLKETFYHGSALGTGEPRHGLDVTKTLETGPMAPLGTSQTIGRSPGSSCSLPPPLHFVTAHGVTDAVSISGAPRTPSCTGWHWVRAGECPGDKPQALKGWNPAPLESPLCISGTSPHRLCG